MFELVLRGPQVPVAVPLCLFRALHAWHGSSSEHAVSQQTPSTQKPLTQSAAHMHACPLLLRVPFVFEHFWPPPPPPQPITAAAQAMKSHSLLTRRTYPARN